MLTHLRIRDFALLDEVELDLGPGFNVLTGETGAGKSLLVDAVALLRGGRGSADVVRAGAEEARIEAVFEPTGSAARSLGERLERAGLEPAEEGLIVRRVIGKSGRGRVYLNGALSTAAALAELAGGLIDLAGQHEHQTLTDPARHITILDAHGVDPALADSVTAAFERVRAAADALKATALDERSRAEREDFLRFQLRELEDANLRPGEDAALKIERERLRSAEKLHAAARHGEHALYAREGAILEELGALGRELSDVGRADPALAQLAAQLVEARVVLEDLADSLRRYAEGMNADPERLAEVDERMHLVGRLLRKHGADVAQVIARREAMAAELASIGAHEERRALAERSLDEARREASRAAGALTDARRKAASALSKQASAALQELGMSGARLHVALSDRPVRDGDEAALTFDGRRLASSGWDRAEFLLAANPGEEPRPLARVASGGELSRVMLALKRVLAHADTVATYVFDEVDAGIGGAVADVVGRQIKSVAADKQVLCVTHLAQIAAYADAHFRVEKRVIDGRTATAVRRLDAGERVEELARMAGGAKVTPKARAHAEDLIKHASRRR
ncbi:MAG: DNA repair protein RecN [Myxococcales bacterium]|nr:DNA repair protein RecN [Myxococcales bacterium]